MSNEESIQTYCPTCKRAERSKKAKSRRGLSSVLYRQIVGKINSAEDLLANKDKLIQIFHQGSNDEALQVFVHDLNDLSREKPFTEVKKWLLEQLVFIDYDSGEKALYRHLYDFYAKEGIDEPFTTFYQNYIYYTGDPMTKNFVSRALGAIGLKAKLVRIDFQGRKKSAMVLRFSAEEVRQAVRDSEVDPLDLEDS